MTTIRELRHSKTVVLAHQSRPGRDDFTTLEAHAERIGALLGRPVRYVSSLFGRPAIEAIDAMQVGDVTVLENTRFYAEEEALADAKLEKMAKTHIVQRLAPHAEYFILDASGVDPGDPTTEFMRREIEDYEQARADSKGLLKKFPTRILLPTDVVLNDDGERRPVTVESLPAKLLVYDIGLDTIAHYVDVIHRAKTIFFNGPAGVFELDPFSVGTRELLTAVAESDGLSVVGGGHTVAAVEQFGLQDRIDHVSTGGGALINFLAGRELPLVTSLRHAYKKFAN